MEVSSCDAWLDPHCIHAQAVLRSMNHFAAFVPRSSGTLPF